jgi:uncharacterized phage protein (TIGR01671 family)
MREIKFRIWDIINLRFVDNKLDSYLISPNDGHILFLDGHDCSPELVAQQYTGLKDKNGKDIYEGDIITSSVWRGFIQPVKFMYGSFGTLETASQTLREILPFDLEVIGNIYEDPEFLELDDKELDKRFNDNIRPIS